MASERITQDTINKAAWAACDTFRAAAVEQLAIWADRISVPVEVLRDYELPAWVGPQTLVIASSKSGDTEETLRQLEAALSRRCPVVCVSAGGALRRVAEAAQQASLRYQIEPHLLFNALTSIRGAVAADGDVAQGIKGIEEIRSVAREGLGTVSAEVLADRRRADPGSARRFVLQARQEDPQAQGRHRHRGHLARADRGARGTEHPNRDSGTPARSRGPALRRAAR